MLISSDFSGKKTNHGLQKATPFAWRQLWRLWCGFNEVTQRTKSLT
jgi:hypothetical protein